MTTHSRMLPKLKPIAAIAIGVSMSAIEIWLAVLAIAIAVQYIPEQVLTPFWTTNQMMISLERGWRILPGFLVLNVLLVVITLFGKGRWVTSAKWAGWAIVAIVAALNFHVAVAENEVAIIDLIVPVTMAWSIIGANWLMGRLLKRRAERQLAFAALR